MSYQNPIQQGNSKLSLGQGKLQGQKLATTTRKSPVAIAIASSVRYSKILKQRQGINTSAGNSKQDFFRFKRFVRALESVEYKKKSSKTPELYPPVNDEASAQKVFIMLIQNQLVLPVRKLKTKESKEKGLPVNKTTPGLEIIHKAVLQPDTYFMWNFEPPNPFLWLYSIIGVAAVFAVVLFPLWPIWMRTGVWYLSTGLLLFIAGFFGIAFIRLIIFIVSYFFMSRRFWLFPNLFADCGVSDSFKPLYGGEEASSKKQGHKHKHHKSTKGANIVSDEKSTEPTTTSSSSKANTTEAKKRTPILEEIADDDN